MRGKPRRNDRRYRRRWDAVAVGNEDDTKREWPGLLILLRGRVLCCLQKSQVRHAGNRGSRGRSWDMILQIGMAEGSSPETFGTTVERAALTPIPS